MKCLTCNSQRGFSTENEAGEQWWTCARCGDEWLIPDTPKVILSPARYAKKTAYHIDPLLAANVVIEQPHNPRGEREQDGSDLWKQRSHDIHGRSVWKPMTLAIVLMLSLVLTRSLQTFAAPSAPASAVTHAHASSDVRLSDNGYHVTQVQYVLRSFGYSVAIDGNYGPQTLRAVKNFQRVNGQVVDGVVGPATQKIMKLQLGEPVTKIQKRVRPPVVSAPGSLTPRSVADPSSVEAMIREVWPANLADRAVAIAYRESRFVPTVRTWCCFGVFQIHKIHLAGLGLTSVEQLYDPRINIEAAYRLYQAAGWGPWNL